MILIKETRFQLVAVGSGMLALSLGLQEQGMGPLWSQVFTKVREYKRDSATDFSQKDLYEK